METHFLNRTVCSVDCFFFSGKPNLDALLLETRSKKSFLVSAKPPGCIPAPRKGRKDFVWASRSAASSGVTVMDRKVTAVASVSSPRLRRTSGGAGRVPAAQVGGTCSSVSECSSPNNRSSSRGI